MQMNDDKAICLLYFLLIYMIFYIFYDKRGGYITEVMIVF